MPYQKIKTRRINYKRLSLFIIITTFFLTLPFTLSQIKNAINFHDPMKHTIKIPLPPTSPYFTFKDGLLGTTGNIIQFFNSNGKLNWSRKISITNSRINGSSSMIVSYQDHAFSLLDANGKIYYSKEVTNTISDVKSGNHYLSILTHDANNEEVIFIYDIKGNIIDEIKYPNLSVIDFGFYGKDDGFWVLNLDNSGLTPVSRISTFKPGVSMTGVISIEDQIVYKVLFTSQDIIAVGTNNILCYNYLGQLNYTSDIYGWKLEDAFIHQIGSIQMIFTPDSNANKNTYSSFSNIRLITIQKEDKILPIGECSKAFLRNDDFITIGKSGITYYNDKGEVKRNINFPFNIIDAIITGDQKGLFIVDKKQVYFYKL